MNANKKITTAAATFGAALTSLYAAPELQADVNDLSFDPSTVAFGGMADAATVQLATDAGPVAAFFQFNSAGGKAVIGSGDVQFLIGSFGQELSNATFVGAGDAGFGADSTGIVFLGFRTDNDPTANVGWFSIDLGGTGGTDTLVEGQYGSQGENVIIGVAIPEPTGGALAALALGALGLRRNRKK